MNDLAYAAVYIFVSLPLALLLERHNRQANRRGADFDPHQRHDGGWHW